MSSIFASFSLCTPLEWLCLNINDPLECTPNPSSTTSWTCPLFNLWFVGDFKLFCLQLHNYNVIRASFQTYKLHHNLKPHLWYFISCHGSSVFIEFIYCFEISVEKHLIWEILSNLPHFEKLVLIWNVHFLFLYVNS